MLSNDDDDRKYLLGLYPKIHNTTAYAVMVYLYMKASGDEIQVTYRDLAEELDISTTTLSSQIDYLCNTCKLLDVTSSIHDGTLIQFRHVAESGQEKVERFLSKIKKTPTGRYQKRIWDGVFSLSLVNNNIEFFEIERSDIPDMYQTLLNAPNSSSIQKLSIDRERIDLIKPAKQKLEQVEDYLAGCNEFFVLFEGGWGRQKINFYDIR